MDDDNAASLDIWLVRVLRTLLVERSVTQTALRLNQTQPAISTALRKRGKSKFFKHISAADHADFFATFSSVKDVLTACSSRLRTIRPSGGLYSIDCRIAH